MEKSLSELADFVGGKVAGDANIKIKGVKTIDEATEGYITFISNKKYENRLNSTKASAIIVAPHIKNEDKTLLVCDNPYLAFAKIVGFMMYKNPVYPKTIDPLAKIGKDVSFGSGVTIFHNVTVGDNAQIGDDVTLYPGVYVGENCQIGNSTTLHPNAVIYNDCKIGARVIIHSNSVIGSPGYGYAPDGKKYFNIPHVGIAVIEDDVVIEPNTSISRAVLGETKVKRGSKIGSLVAVGHNTIIGEDTLIVTQSGIAGSTTIGNNVVVAAQAGVSGHIKVGDNVILGGRTGVANDLPPNGVYLGTPALPIERMRRCYAVIKNLPEMRSTIKLLKKKIELLEENQK